MNHCDHVRALLSAQIDGELSTPEAQLVDQHLLSCAECRAEREAMVEIDKRLADALVITDVSRKCESILQAAACTVQPKPKQILKWRNLAIVLSIAAVFVVALLPLFFEQRQAEPSPTFIAHLVRATGPVKYLTPGANDWSEALPDSRSAFVAGSRLKTDTGVMCEVSISTNGTIRLDEAAEVVIKEPNQWMLVKGQLWCLPSAPTTIDVAISEGTEWAPTALIFACPAKTELQCAASDNEAKCDSISSNNAIATMTGEKTTCSVAPGESISIRSDLKVDRESIPDNSTKIWQLPLLAVGKEIDTELVMLLDRVLAPIGMTKARHMNEDQIRLLGPSGAIPLLAYVVSETAPENLHLRRTAVRLASEISDVRGVRQWKLLTSDPDEYIASVAKSTLERISP